MWCCFLSLSRDAATNLAPQERGVDLILAFTTALAVTGKAFYGTLKSLGDLGSVNTGVNIWIGSVNILR